MSKRISNFQIKDPIKNLEEDETMKNFVGMFPANHMNTFISFKPTISEKTVKYPFLRILTAQIKAVHIGDVTNTKNVYTNKCSNKNSKSNWTKTRTKTKTTRIVAAEFCI